MRRITILLAALGALLLVPAAGAFAQNYSGYIKVNMAGSGSGEVVNWTEFEGFYNASNPPIACKYNGVSKSGTCEAEVAETGEEEESNYWAAPLEAVAAPGSSFSGWTVQKGQNQFFCPWKAQGANVCNMVSSEEGEDEFEVTANFVKSGPPLTLNVEEGSGAVVSNPAGLECTKSAGESCTTEVVQAGKVTLTASPAPGYLVKSWKGCDSGGVNGRQCTVTLAEPGKTVGVKFYKVFELQGSKTGGQGIMGTAPGGINCGYACKSSTALYKEGSLTVKAKPAKNFHFVEFTGGTGSAESCNGVTAPECTIASFSSDSKIQEVYAEDAKHTLTLEKTGGGQGFVKTKPTNINCGLTCTKAAASFYASETAEVTVTLGKGTSSVTWFKGAGTCTGNALTCTVPMSSEPQLVAKFE